MRPHRNFHNVITTELPTLWNSYQAKHPIPSTPHWLPGNKTLTQKNERPTVRPLPKLPAPLTTFLFWPPSTWLHFRQIASHLIQTCWTLVLSWTALCLPTTLPLKEIVQWKSFFYCIITCSVFVWCHYLTWFPKKCKERKEEIDWKVNYPIERSLKE